MFPSPLVSRCVADAKRLGKIPKITSGEFSNCEEVVLNYAVFIFVLNGFMEMRH